MSAGRLSARDAIRETAHKTSHRYSPVKRGTVTKTAPLTVQEFGFTHPLTLDNDFDLTQLMKVYAARVGFRVGDLVLMAHHDSLVLFDVVSDTPTGAF